MNRKIIFTAIFFLVLIFAACRPFDPTNTEIYSATFLINNYTPEKINLTADMKDAGNYSFIFNIPGYGLEVGNCNYWQTIAGQAGAGSITTILAAPINRTIHFINKNPVPDNYVYRGGISYNCRYSYRHHDDYYIERAYLANSDREQIHDSIFKGIEGKAGEVEEYYFGGPYIPGSINVYGNRIGPETRMMKGKNTYVNKNTQYSLNYKDVQKTFIWSIPHIRLYENNNLKMDKNISSNNQWGEIYGYNYYGSYGYHYKVNITLPFERPVMNDTHVVSEFILRQNGDSQPPKLDELNIPVSFEDNLTLSFHVMEQNDVNASIYYKNATSKDWKEALVKKTDYDFIGIVSNLTSYTNLDMKIALTDTFGNNQTYYFYPASIHKRNLTLKFLNEPVIGTGKNIRLEGQIYDSFTGRPEDYQVMGLYNGDKLLIKDYTSPQQINETHYRYGRFDIKFQVPEHFILDDLRLQYGGTGIFPVQQTNLMQYVEGFTRDVSISAVELSKVFDNNTLYANVSLINKGTEEVTVNLSFSIKGLSSLYDWINNDVSIIMQPKTSANHLFWINFSDVRNMVEYKAYADLSGDEYLGDNSLEGINVLKFVNDIFIVEYAIEPEPLLVNRTSKLHITLKNVGEDKYGVNLTLPNLNINTLINLTKEYTNFTVPVVFNESGRVLITGKIDHHKDIYTDNNNIALSLSTYNPSDLSLHLEDNIYIYDEPNPITFKVKNSLFSAPKTLIKVYTNDILLKNWTERIIESGNTTFDLTWIPTKLGINTIRIEAETYNEINESNNVLKRSVHVKPSGADPELLVYNATQENITFLILDRGTYQSENITFSYYELENNIYFKDNKYHLNQTYLLKDQKFISNLSVLPDRKITVQINNSNLPKSAVINSPTDNYLYNNLVNISKSDVNDALHDFTFLNQALVNNSVNIAGYILSLNSSIPELNVSFYINSVLNATKTIPLDSKFKNYNFSFTPNSLDVFRFAVKIHSPADIRPNNDIVEKSITTYNQKKVDFTIHDSLGKSIKRKIKILDENIVDGSSQLLAPDKDNITLSLSITDDSNEDIVRLELTASSLDKETITSHYSQTQGKLKNIFANSFSFDLADRVTVTFKRDTTEDYEIVYCSKFNYSSLKCQNTFSTFSTNAEAWQTSSTNYSDNFISTQIVGNFDAVALQPLTDINQPPELGGGPSGGGSGGSGTSNTDDIGILSPDDDVCLSSWICSSWSSCKDNVQTRRCEDVNACGNGSNKPIEEKDCCLSNWQCKEWMPKICPENETQYRECTDLNSCSPPTSDAEVQRSCEYTLEQSDIGDYEKFSISWIAYVAISILILVIVLIIILLIVSHVKSYRILLGKFISRELNEGIELDHILKGLKESGVKIKELEKSMSRNK